MSENIVNHYEICCLLYAGNIAEAQRTFSEKIKGLEMTPPVRNVFLSSLNYAIYNFILVQEQVSLHECCMENEQKIARAASDSLLETGNKIIFSYGTDRRYLTEKYENPHIRQAVAYIHSHMSEELTLKNVSEILYLSKNYFCQLFRKEVGVSFSNYVCNQRLKLAQRLLKGTSLPIQTIAEKCGFQTAAYFSACCRKYLDCTPSDLRKFR